MKFIDRVPAKPNKRKIVDVDTGKSTSAYISYDDEPINEGTPFSAANLNAITNDIVRAINATDACVMRDSDGKLLTSTVNFKSNVWKCPDSQFALDIDESKTYNFSLSIPVEKAYRYYNIIARYSLTQKYNFNTYITLTTTNSNNDDSISAYTGVGNLVTSDAILGSTYMKSHTYPVGSHCDKKSVDLDLELTISNKEGGTIAGGNVYSDFEVYLEITQVESKQFLDEV